MVLVFVMALIWASVCWAVGAPLWLSVPLGLGLGYATAWAEQYLR